MDEFEGLKREVERLLDMVDSENSDCEEKIAIQEEVGDLPSSSVAVEFLEDEIDRKEEILLAASCTLLNMISGLDHSFDGNERDMGRLQVEEFRAACLGHKVLVNETEEQTFERADLIRTLWQKKNSRLCAFGLLTRGKGDAVSSLRSNRIRGTQNGLG
jgi:hypothetical protein